MVRFGLMGLSFKDPNKGCEALTFTFLKMLQEICEGVDYEIVCFRDTDDLGKIPEFFPNLKICVHVLNIYSLSSWISAYKRIKGLDAVFDGSYGDGFTGIYGTRRNGIQVLRKQIVYWAGKPLFLLPQTYGKYKFPFIAWSKKMIRNAVLAYARDDTAMMVEGCGVKTTSDMAFMLPYDKKMYSFEQGKKKFGINVSSLLWDNDTVGRFELTVNYRQFYKQLIEYLLNETDYEVHLIPHVIDEKRMEAPENDCRTCDELADIFKGKVIVAPAFGSALEAKSYICNMDIFMGSRMHSTIGAISSGVVTIPFSYCHKFESLYSKIGYQYVLSATKLSNEEALATIKLWISNSLLLKKNGEEAVSKAMKELSAFKVDLRQSILGLGINSFDIR